MKNYLHDDWLIFSYPNAMEWAGNLILLCFFDCVYS